MMLRVMLPERVVQVVLDLPRGPTVLVTLLLGLSFVLVVMLVPRFPWRMVILDPDDLFAMIWSSERIELSHFGGRNSKNYLTLPSIIWCAR